MIRRLAEIRRVDAKMVLQPFPLSTESVLGITVSSLRSLVGIELGLHGRVPSCQHFGSRVEVLQKGQEDRGHLACNQRLVHIVESGYTDFAATFWIGKDVT